MEQKGADGTFSSCLFRLQWGKITIQIWSNRL